METKRARTLTESKTSILDLPPDVLLQIISRLSNHDRLSSLPFVSKSFQTLTNGCINGLSFKVKLLPSASDLSKLFSRFNSVTHISIESTTIYRALNAVAESSLKIEHLSILKKPSSLPCENTMNRLSSRLGDVKVLTLKWSRNLMRSRIVEFIHMFQSLEKLNLSGCSGLEDREICRLASKANNLRKINLNGNFLLSDCALDALSNCVNLEHITFEGCTQITIQGFCSFVRKRKNLMSVDVPCHFQYYRIGVSIQIPEDDVQTLAETISSCGNLIHLSIIKGLVTDALLSVIANSHSHLMSLVYKDSIVPQLGYTMRGLSTVVRAFQGLTKLHFSLPTCRLVTQDTQMSQLVESLVHLKEVNLKSHTALYATLFSLINNCPLLESINIEYSWDSNHDWDNNIPQLIKKNSSIQRISIYPKPDTAVITVLRSICPSMKSSNN